MAAVEPEEKESDFSGKLKMQKLYGLYPNLDLSIAYVVATMQKGIPAALQPIRPTHLYLQNQNCLNIAVENKSPPDWKMSVAPTTCISLPHKEQKTVRVDKKHSAAFVHGGKFVVHLINYALLHAKYKIPDWIIAQVMQDVSVDYDVGLFLDVPEKWADDGTWGPDVDPKLPEFIYSAPYDSDAKRQKTKLNPVLDKYGRLVMQLTKSAMDSIPSAGKSLWRKAFDAKTPRAKPTLDDFTVASERSGPLVVELTQGNPDTFGSAVVTVMADGIGCLLMDFQISLQNLSTASPNYPSPARGYLNGDGTPPDMLSIPCSINGGPVFHLDTISLVEQMFVGIGTRLEGDICHRDLQSYANATPPHNKAPRQQRGYVDLMKYEETPQLLDDFFSEFWRHHHADWKKRGRWRDHFSTIEQRRGIEILDPKELRKMKVRYQRDMILCSIFYHALHDLMHTKDDMKLQIAAALLYHTSYKKGISAFEDTLTLCSQRTDAIMMLCGLFEREKAERRATIATVYGILSRWHEIDTLAEARKKELYEKIVAIVK